MFKILIIEDDENIAFAIKSFLLKNNYNIIHAKTLEESKFIFNNYVDLILLDLNLPDGSGFEFCNYIKKVNDTPIIFITVRDDEKDIIKGLDIGGDDYITKPFKLSILLSRITAVLRRTVKQNLQEDILYCKNIKLIKSKTLVYKNNNQIDLTSGEYSLLLKLLENKNSTLTRDVLLEQLWDCNGKFVNNNTLSVAIKRLREKLEDDSIIKTIRGIGYRLED